PLTTRIQLQARLDAGAKALASKRNKLLRDMVDRGKFCSFCWSFAFSDDHFCFACAEIVTAKQACENALAIGRQIVVVEASIGSDESAVQYTLKQLRRYAKGSIIVLGVSSSLMISLWGLNQGCARCCDDSV